MSVYGQTLWKFKTNAVITSYSPVVMPQLLNPVISAYLPCSATFSKPPLCHGSTGPLLLTPAGAAQVSPQALRLLLFPSPEESLCPFLAEVDKEMGELCQWEAGNEESIFAWLWRTPQQCFSHEEGVPGASFWCVWSCSLPIHMAELWADVNHITSSCLYSLQDVKLEIAQSSQEIIW